MTDQPCLLCGQNSYTPIHEVCFIESLKKLRLSKAGPETLDASFIGAMQEIGLFGLLKHAKDDYQKFDIRPINNGKVRDMVLHASEHMSKYLSGEFHELGNCKYHLAAAAFNMMMEFYFYQKETEN